MNAAPPLDEPLIKKRTRPNLSKGPHRTLELFAVILIIALLVAYAMPRYMTCRKKAALMTFTGLSDTMKMSQVYYSLTGQWPENGNDLKDLPVTGGPSNDPFIDHVRVEEGAVHFTYKGELAGKTLTLRPAVPSADPLGPVIWIAGHSGKRPGWSVTGTDRSDIDPALIGPALK